ncbi:MAG: hypothetical protein MUO31_09470, partial [Thermodesulfovibrionales bacterium]|nr:hypothetical protein [Thermodesulfovibrionales bacterium]
GAVGDDARGIDLVRGVVIVFGDHGLVLGYQLVAHVDVVPHAGAGGIIFSKQFAVEGVPAAYRSTHPCTVPVPPVPQRTGITLK